MSAQNGLVQRPFLEASGLGEAAQVVGDDLAQVVDEISEILAA